MKFKIKFRRKNLAANAPNPNACLCTANAFQRELSVMNNVLAISAETTLIFRKKDSMREK
jgi:hypothetical protein